MLICIRFPFIDRSFSGGNTDTIGKQNLDFNYLHMRKRGQGSFHSMYRLLKLMCEAMGSLI